MLGQVLSVLADADINVIDMLNKSRDELAYNLLDLEEEPTEAAMAIIRALEGVVNARLVRPWATHGPSAISHQNGASSL